MSNLIGQVDWSLVIKPVVEHGLRIFLILLLAFVLHRVLRRLVARVTRSAVVRERHDLSEMEIAKRSDTLTSVNLVIIDIALIILAVFMILAEVGIDVTALIAGAGIIGIAVGFGAQSLVKDIITGFFIILDNQYNKGDVVGVAGVFGYVEELNLRRTVLRDLDGAVHSVPNGAITIATNLTREWSRVNLNVQVAYGEDLDKVAEVLNRVGKELAEDKYWGAFITEAPQVLRVDNFEESGIAIKMLGVTQPMKQWDVMGELRRRIKKAFDQEGIEIPYPHRVIIQRGASHPGA
jgi:small conductance mechanosensitive channel